MATTGQFTLNLKANFGKFVSQVKSLGSKVKAVFKRTGKTASKTAKKVQADVSKAAKKTASAVKQQAAAVQVTVKTVAEAIQLDNVRTQNAIRLDATTTANRIKTIVARAKATVIQNAFRARIAIRKAAAQTRASVERDAIRTANQIKVQSQKAAADLIRSSTLARQKMAFNNQQTANSFALMQERARLFGKKSKKSFGLARGGVLDFVFALGLVKLAFSGLLKPAAQFETAMKKVSVLMSEQEKEILPALGREAQSLAVEFGVSIGEIGDAMRQVRQRSIPASEVMGVLRNSLNLAVGGFGKLESAVEIVTALLISFKLESSKAAALTDLLAKAQEKGSFEFAQLEGKLGKVSSAARITGISVKEMLVSLALLTKAGLAPAPAITFLTRLLLAFVKNTNEAKAFAEEFGFSLDVTTLRTRGLTGALEELGDLDLSKLIKVFPRIRAGLGAAVLLDNIKTLRRDMDVEFENIGGLAEDRAEDVLATFDKQMDRLTESFKLAMKVLFLPAIEGLADLVSNAVSAAEKIVAVVDAARVLIGGSIAVLVRGFLLVGESIGALLSAGIEGLAVVVKRGNNDINSFFKSMGERIAKLQEDFKAAANSAKETGEDIADAVKLTAEEAAAAAKAAAEEAKAAADEAAATAKAVAKDAEAAKAVSDKAAAAAKIVSKGASDAVKAAAEKIAAAAKLTAKIMAESAKVAAAAANVAAEEAATAAKASALKAAAAFKAATESSKAALLDAAEAAERASQKATDRVKELAGETADAIKAAAERAASGVKVAALKAAAAAKQALNDAQSRLKRLQDGFDDFNKLAEDARNRRNEARDKEGEILEKAFDRELKFIDELGIAESEKLGLKINALQEFLANLKNHNLDVDEIEQRLSDLRRKRAEAIAKDIAEQLKNSSSLAIKQLEIQKERLEREVFNIRKSANERDFAERQLQRVQRELSLERLKKQQFDLDIFFRREQKALIAARARGELTEEEFNRAQADLRAGRLASELEALSQVLDKDVLTGAERASVEKKRQAIAKQLAKSRLDDIDKDEDKAKKAAKEKAKAEGKSNKEIKEEQEQIEEEFDKKREEAVGEFLRNTGKAREVKAKQAAEDEAGKRIEAQKEELDEAAKAREDAEKQLKEIESAAAAVAKAISEQIEKIRRLIDAAAAAARKLLDLTRQAGAAAAGGLPVPPAGGAAPRAAPRPPGPGPLPGSPFAQAAREKEIEALMRQGLSRAEAEEAVKGGGILREGQRAPGFGGRPQRGEAPAPMPATDANQESTPAPRVPGGGFPGGLPRRGAGAFPVPDTGVLPSIDPFGRRAPAGTTPAHTVEGLDMAKLIDCLCHKPCDCPKPTIAAVNIEQTNVFTGLPSNLDVKRVTKKISREMADRLIDTFGFPEDSSFTGNKS